MTVTSGGLGAAVAGGLIGSVAPNLIGGRTGAIVGAVVGDRQTTHVCTSLEVIIILKGSYTKSLTINLINEEVSRSSAQYLEAKLNGQKCIDFLKRITGSEDDSARYVQAGISAADEIRKFKELFDSGIITQDEFNAKKKQLLGL